MQTNRTRLDLTTPLVDVIDVGLSDHSLIRWSAPLVRPCPEYVTVTGRPWKRLNTSAFRTALQASPLCQPVSWTDLDIDSLADLYDTVITAIADRVAPVRTVKRRCRASDPWFDDDCRVAKWLTKLLERHSRHAARMATNARRL